MISVNEAQNRIVETFCKLSAEDVSLETSLGRVLAEDILSRRSQPPTSVSAMDGYAVRTADLEKIPHNLIQVGSAPAGQSFNGVLGVNETVRIFTGAPVPEGTDAIVIQENTKVQDEKVIVTVRPRVGQYIRRAGLDFKEGDLGISAGKVLSARDVALAAAMDYPWLSVHRKPRIAILATGDEIVRPGEPIGPNQIVSSNAFGLAALVDACGGKSINLGIAPDQSEILQAMAKGASGADLLVTSGGISVGEHDLVRSALSAQGLKVDFWKVAMRPGKPVMFGKLHGVPVLGLPGNPVSVIVCAMIFLLPVIQRLLGLPPGLANVMEKALLSSSLPENDERQDYLRGTLKCKEDGSLWTRPFERQDSSMLSVLAQADCLIVRPPHAEQVSPGKLVDIIRFPSSLTHL